ncbi:hypothetical protein [Niallia circulans]|uniref:hypothetical protein n=1 Tax=Niallia circulans TaxID=1397 RepID=UPI0035269855
MNKNSMLPDYANSGGKGKAKSLTEAKTGSPRRVNISGDSYRIKNHLEQEKE